MSIGLMLLVFGVRTFVVEPFTIPSKSMYPTLQIGDHALISKLGYGNYDFFGIDIANTGRYRTINRGDVMVFIYPNDPDLEFIKRVTGLPGDEIRYQGKRVIIDGKEIPQVEKQNSTTPSDNENSSRHIESIEQTSYEIALNNDFNAKPDIKLTVPQGHYFVLGDNRDNSNDSRYWGCLLYTSDAADE